MDYLEAILLGIIQGATEFLPVSSSGHLLLTQRLFNMDDKTFGLTFDVALHMGTLLALLFFFRNDIIALPRTLSASLAGRKASNAPTLVASGHPGLLPDEAVSAKGETPEQAGLFTARLIGLIVTACIPAVVVGAFLSDFIESNVREPLVVALMLAVFGIILLIADRVSPKNRTMSELTYPQAFLIGLAQALALVPGVSRAGITMTVGLFLGLKRDQAARFSFLMAIPIIAGAGAKQGLGIFKEHVTGTQLGLMAVGVVVAAVTGYFALKFLIQFLNNFSLAAFAYYRVALAIVVALVFIFVK